MENRTLLQKYDIPITHLDFDYIKTCEKVKELERIVLILRSGEEGYYPELTKCAEEKLKELKPQSRALRTEERLLTRHSFSEKDWKEHTTPISEWSTDIKNKDTVLSSLQDNSENNVESIILPPIRKGGKVDPKNAKENIIGTKSKDTLPPAATNYSQWDKYDADAEILKMDLEQERAKEQIERMNRLNQNKSKGIEAIEEAKPLNVYEKLSPIEKEKLSEDYKIRGNEYFKSKEYSSALEHYTRCIEIQPSLAGYNNRAIANLKLQKYSDALLDCNECLKREAHNLKALLRKAEAFLGLGQKLDAFRTYEQIQLIEPTNAVACKALESLRKELGEVAPTHATRLQIIENNDSNEKPIKTSEPIKPKPKPTQQVKPPPPEDYDLAELIKPNKVVQNNLMKTMESFGKLATKTENKKKTPNEKVKKPLLPNAAPEIRLNIPDPGAINRKQGEKLLIEEL